METTAAGVAAAVPIDLRAGRGQAADAEAPAPRTEIHVRVNGQPHRIEVEDRWTLAELLRDHLHLTGTKIGCDRSECGACTVLLDGAPVYSCSYLAVWTDGASVETVENLAAAGRLHPLQQAFIAHDAPQCGFCTSGQLMSAKALLDANPHPSAAEARSALAGNLCRCSNYNHYIAAVLAAAEQTGREDRSGDPA